MSQSIQYLIMLNDTMTKCHIQNVNTHNLYTMNS